MTANAAGFGGRPSPVGASIHLAPQQGSALHPGQSVIVHVIKRLDAGKWAVGVLGKVYPAASSLALERERSCVRAWAGPWVDSSSPFQTWFPTRC